MPEDPLSEVLALLKPRSYVSSGFDAGGDWSILFQTPMIKSYVVISGGCWLSVTGVDDPVRLGAGDCFVLPTGRPFRLASDLELPSVDAVSVFPPVRDGGVLTYNGGGDFFIVGSRFSVSGDYAALLLSALPPVVHLRYASDKEAMRWSVERMMQELREKQPGGILMAQHLAHMILVQALRLHLQNEGPGRVGWFSALADRQLSAALSAMHGDPARRWTLQELAERAGMSRSAFAARFRQVVGETPIDYLARWRMLLASERLTATDDVLSNISASLGYESESAFSAAFKRIMGSSPRRFARGQREEGQNGLA